MKQGLDAYNRATWSKMIISIAKYRAWIMANYDNDDRRIILCDYLWAAEKLIWQISSDAPNGVDNDG